MKKRINISLDSLIHEKGIKLAHLHGLKFSSYLEFLLEDELTKMSTTNLVSKNTNLISDLDDSKHYSPLELPKSVISFSHFPKEIQDQALLFAQFLHNQLKREISKVDRKPGILKGEIEISSDFDSEIEDFNHYS